MSGRHFNRDPLYDSTPIGGGLPNHRRIIKDFPGVLDVVAVVSNPMRYRSRYDLYRAFERHMVDSGVRLTTVELAYGGRLWEVTSSDNPRHVQVRTDHELWHKENMINLGVSRLPRDWEYVAWIDADITFARPDWVQETLQQLQHYDVVQPWSMAHDTDLAGETTSTFRSFCRCYREYVDEGYGVGGAEISPVDAGYYARGYPTAQVGPSRGYWHPGFAWAMRRAAWESVGGLIDFAILGAADFYMAWGLIGQLSTHLYHIEIDTDSMGGYTSAYLRALMRWQDRAVKVRRNIGFVPGTIMHGFHGPKAKRSYNKRESILIGEKYDPDRDISKDWQGVYQLNEDRITLRDRVRAYFRNRDEDATS